MIHNKTPTTLQKVPPTKTILITSCPCEEQNAYIRGEAVEAIKKGKLNAVTYRYLQSKRGENTTFAEAVFWGACTIAQGAASLYLYYEFSMLANEKDGNSDNVDQLLRVIVGILGFWCLVPFCNSIINVNNTKRYKETNQGCEEWLKNKVGENAVEKIKTLNYHQYKYGNKKKLVQQFIHSVQ